MTQDFISKVMYNFHFLILNTFVIISDVTMLIHCAAVKLGGEGILYNLAAIWIKGLCEVVYFAWQENHSCNFSTL
jgi:hypothetical protein